MDKKEERLRSIEANAWKAYQEARRKMHEKRNATRTQAVVDEGQRWQDRNFDLHRYLESRS